MFKPNKLLKVVSIILIVFAVLGMFFSILGYGVIASMDDVVNGIDMTGVKALMTPAALAVSVISGLLMLASGIFGLLGRSAKLCMILMGIYIVIAVVNIIVAIPSAGFSALSVIDFILPLLYLWGVYQSKE